MPTVIDDITGEEVAVMPVEATVAISSIVNLANELPADAATRIEQAMAGAIMNAHADGISDPDEIKARMLEARASVKRALYNEMKADGEAR